MPKKIVTPVEVRRTTRVTRASSSMKLTEALKSNKEPAIPITKSIKVAKVATPAKASKSTKINSDQTKEQEPSKPLANTKPIKTTKKLSEIEQAIADYKKREEECTKLDPTMIRELQKKMKTVFDTAKRDNQVFEERVASKKTSRTRSGLKRNGPQPTSNGSNGKFVCKGMDDATEKYADDEIAYLKKEVAKVKNVCDLKFEHIKYLVGNVFLDQLKRIKQGEIQSDFHDRYVNLTGSSKTELLADIRTSLFSGDQVDYIQGLLQGYFETNAKDEKGDIKHEEIKYVEIVMVSEVTTRIVKFVHNFDTLEETAAFVKKHSREAHGLSDDDEIE